jgi:hypothetical protein
MVRGKPFDVWHRSSGRMLAQGGQKKKSNRWSFWRFFGEI